MPLFGLIGHPLSHSYSKEFFTNYFLEQGLRDHHYDLFDLPGIALFQELVATRKPSGLNVTIPYKEKIIPFLDRLDSQAELIGAVNCIHLNEGILTGYNTDYTAFLETLDLLQPDVPGAALVFGTGGASRAVCTALTTAGISFKVVSRTPEDHQLAYGQLTHIHFREHKLLINCTPAGMWPRTAERLQLPYECITEKHVAYDLIYNPAETLFLKDCRLRGARTLNGMEMLKRQALHSWKIWNSKR